MSVKQSVEVVKTDLWGVKIVRYKGYKKAHQSAVSERVYYRKGLSFDLLSKYKWYFEYRKALAKVEQPHFHVEAHYFRYKPETEKEKAKALTRQKASLKAQVTKTQKKVDEIKEAIAKHVDWYNTTQIAFTPVEQTEPYRMAMARLHKEEMKLIEKKNKLKEIAQ